MYLYILIGVLALMLVIIRLYGRSVLGFRNREGFSSGAELLIVKAKWCGHCVKAKDDFEKLEKASPVKLSDGSEVTVRILDEADDKSEVAALNVKGFPTILYQPSSGSRQEYSGARTYDGVMSFLQQQ
jgi:thiol-disulfide isomerase/thioredoxin